MTRPLADVTHLFTEDVKETPTTSSRKEIASNLAEDAGIVRITDHHHHPDGLQARGHQKVKVFPAPFSFFLGMVTVILFVRVLATSLEIVVDGQEFQSCTKRRYF